MQDDLYSPPALRYLPPYLLKEHNCFSPTNYNRTVIRMSKSFCFL